ncbi:MAG TPA: DUF58 domain-containing protein [Polyangiaceae bacterium]|nr:DUF58 domain-containing protein [Polyangiaceae bacterium]
MTEVRSKLDWGTFAPLRLKARSVADGVYAGSHKSPRKGSGVEFGGHRAYVPGDDLRYIDRHALMRHGALLIREFETETDRDLWLFVDATKSMSYAGPGAPGPKYGFAALLAAALAYVAVRTGDRVALDFLGGQGARSVPPRAGRDAFERIVTALEDVEPDGDLSEDRAQIEQALGQAQRSARRGAIQVVLTDLLDFPSGSLDALTTLTTRSRSLQVVQVLSPAERDFPFEGAVQLRGLEGKSLVETDAAQARKSYLAALAAAQRQAAEQLLPRGGRLLSCSTADSAELLVRKILSLGMEPNR